MIMFYYDMKTIGYTYEYYEYFLTLDILHSIVSYRMLKLCYCILSYLKRHKN